MTFDQLVAEVAAAPSQVEAFQVLMTCLRIEITDASTGDTPPPSVNAKFDSIFSQTSAKANEILNAIETGKPALAPIIAKEVPASAPNGPVTLVPQPEVFKDKPAPVSEPVVVEKVPEPAAL